MSKLAAFWDASALVPLLTDQGTTRQGRAYLRQFTPVVWWGSRVEVHSAIARLHRSDDIDAVGKRNALAGLHILGERWREILPDEALRSLAMKLLDTYSLRAADSMQLAAALTWCQQRPSQRNFICGDDRLSDAAESAGFLVKRLSAT